MAWSTSAPSPEGSNVSSRGRLTPPLKPSWGDDGLSGNRVPPRVRSTNYFWFAAAIGATAIAMLAGGLAEFAYQTDLVAKQREETVISNGIQSRMKEIGSLIVPTAVWDDAVVNLDNHFSPSWARKNIGQFFSAANNFDFAYVLNAQDGAVYGMEAARDRPPADYEKLSVHASNLVAEVRAAERSLKLPQASENGENLRAPIQATAPKVIGNEHFFVTATLVQPDFGTAQINGDRAPIIVTGRKLDETFMAEFGQRYLLEDAHIHVGDATWESDEAHVGIKDEGGALVATLDWRPQTPGSALLAQILPLTLGLLLLLLTAALMHYRKARRATDALVQSERLATHIAYHDALTELPNRAYLERSLSQFMLKARTQGHTAAIHCLDLDHFKELNDIFGSEVGDEALRLVSQRLLEQCSSDDICVRFGGDGFAIAQLQGDSPQVEAMAKRIISALSTPLDLNIGSRTISCSVGSAIADEVGLSPLELVRRADLALHVAKEAGLSRHCLFTKALDEVLRSRHELLDDLRSDLTKDRLRMVYQPQVNGFGRIIGVEALVRWTHPKRGAVSPAVFIPLAESCGLIADLGAFTIRRVLEDARRWPDLKVAINISAIQLRMPGFAERLKQMTAAANVDPARIEVELTEGILLSDDEQIRSMLGELRDAGFSLTLDDFGTGYSSLSYLSRFPIDKIKIDRAFIGTLGIDKRADAVVAAIVALARALNLSVIAEGVETNDQWNHLLKEGCSDIQGYIASEALEADLISAFLLRKEPICPAPAGILAAQV